MTMENVEDKETMEKMRTQHLEPHVLVVPVFQSTRSGL